MARQDEVAFKTMKAARAAGLRTEDEWTKREKLPNGRWRRGIIPRREAAPILVKGTKFFRLDQCEQIISRKRAKRLGLVVRQDAVPVKTYQIEHPFCRISYEGFRLSDCIPKQMRQQPTTAVGLHNETD